MTDIEAAIEREAEARATRAEAHAERLAGALGGLMDANVIEAGKAGSKLEWTDGPAGYAAISAAARALAAYRGVKDEASIKGQET